MKKFTQERQERMERRERTRQELLNKNKTTAKNMKDIICKELENNKVIQEQKILSIKERTVKEKLDKSIAMFNKNYKKERINYMLEKELKEFQFNEELLKNLKNKETELVAELQDTLNTSTEVIEKAKNTPYLSVYHDKISKTARNNDTLDSNTTTLESYE